MQADVLINAIMSAAQGRDPEDIKVVIQAGHGMKEGALCSDLLDVSWSEGLPGVVVEVADTSTL